MLVVRTPLQLQMFTAFAPGRVVCMDLTHGTNQYRFCLITLLVVDDFGEVYPVGWCITNREDEQALCLFLEKVYKNTGRIMSPLWFMSDEANQYFGAWTKVFGEGCNKLLCSWHVDRSWRGLKAIGDSHLEALVYKQLKALMEEPKKAMFDTMLKQCLKEWKSHVKTRDFARYFEKEYAWRTPQWALTYRVGSCINTNIFVEAFHRVLKHVYLHGTLNRRLDILINTLLRFARDKGFERLFKLSKGKSKGTRSS